ncbi:unnamed protein product [Larinioides sclopetarius]|uniref:Uncharacterized protein n=1 Tax=Larinioides sclopetarius TaxID=280406 RepID=A0AAV1ZC89_9ARAC
MGKFYKRKRDRQSWGKPHDGSRCILRKSNNRSVNLPET